MYRRGIANKTDGVNYRSLLEAKWARFFHYLDWDFQYEPFELEKWIPDFGIAFGRHEVLFEIKPSMTERSLLSETVKAQKNAGEHGVAVCGFSPWITYETGDSVSGFFYNHEVSDEPFFILPCVQCGGWAITYSQFFVNHFIPRNNDPGKYEIVQLCRSGKCDTIYDPIEFKKAKKPGAGSLNMHWKNACNDVQWCSVKQRIRS